ncbi:MAG TPA: DUF3303 family protein [Planctomycetota bacterium]|jgi:hypothetical protein|nr:DUF3303 family protein [Planctomycetota bacterium]
MLYMIVERFRGGDAVPVYRRFRESGRLAPEGLRYVSSWVSADLLRCYQLMECEDPKLIDRWIVHWSDLVEFEVVPVVTSSEAVETIAPRLGQGATAPAGKPPCAGPPSGAERA